MQSIDVDIVSRQGGQCVKLKGNCKVIALPEFPAVFSYYNVTSKTEEPTFLPDSYICRIRRNTATPDESSTDTFIRTGTTEFNTRQEMTGFNTVDLSNNKFNRARMPVLQWLLKITESPDLDTLQTQMAHRYGVNQNYTSPILSASALSTSAYAEVVVANFIQHILTTKHAGWTSYRTAATSTSAKSFTRGRTLNFIPIQEPTADHFIISITDAS